MEDKATTYRCPRCGAATRLCGLEPHCYHCTEESCGWCGYREHYDDKALDSYRARRTLIDARRDAAERNAAQFGTDPSWYGLESL